ncbi:MAG: cytochrome c oxidase subunit II [Rhodospirillaceae bacterium]|nr:MAG: cytochrome c oxidase subunit II [Rhodospirillaceae bacterium]
MTRCRLSFANSRWGVLALTVATLALVVAMPAWRWIGTPPPAFEAYPVTTDVFLAQVDAMISAHATGAESEGLPVVHPPPGDLYLAVQRFRFMPVLELEAGHAYRLHVATVDGVHGFNFPLAGADLLLVPGRAAVMSLTPTTRGYYAMQCSEYCGLDHNRMKGWVRVE